MKTNVIMIRHMGGIEVSQRTKDSMFNATLFLKHFNRTSAIQKELKEYLDNKATKLFIESMSDDDDFIIGGIPPIIKSKANKGENAGTWMHPYLFIDFAMWLNPKFKLSVLRFVYDELIKNRHEAGDMYRTLSSSGMKLKGYDFKEVATALQWIAFNETGKNLRQTGSQEQLKVLAETQTKLAFAIDMGFIKTYAALISAMRDMWKSRYNNCPIQKIA